MLDGSLEYFVVALDSNASSKNHTLITTIESSYVIRKSLEVVRYSEGLMLVFVVIVDEDSFQCNHGIVVSLDYILYLRESVVGVRALVESKCIERWQC